MLQGIGRLNSSTLQATQNATSKQINKTNVQKSSRIDLFEASKLPPFPEMCSKVAPESMSQEEYEKYCGLYTTSDGLNTYFPPNTASPATIKAWIDGLKQLEATGNGGQIASLKMGIIHQLEEVEAGSVWGANSYEDILCKLLAEQERILNSGMTCGLDPQTFREKQERFISTIRLMLDTFYKTESK